MQITLLSAARGDNGRARLQTARGHLRLHPCCLLGMVYYGCRSIELIQAGRTIYKDPMPSIDLSECEQEPIHIPGTIQGHGALLVVDRARDLVIAASANCEALLGCSERELLGQPWQPHCQVWNLAESELPVGPESCTWQRTMNGRELSVQGHQSGGLAYYEFEPTLPMADEAPAPGPWTQAMSGTQPVNIFRACQLLAEEVSQVCVYDRVMVYRFLPDWSGEVVAEVRADEMVPFIGLRYPASDIPAQARDLYRRNPFREIVDVNAINVTLEVVPGTDPVDCSYCHLRSVSPYHLEYLRNMGVAASMSCAIFNRQGELWGLLACHHRRPHALTPEFREHTLRLTREFTHWMTEQKRAAEERVDLLRQLEEQSMTTAFGQVDARQLLQRLMIGRFSLPVAFGADGAAVVIGDEVVAMGQAPEIAWLRQVARWLEGHAESVESGHQYYISHEQSTAFAPSTAACGLLAGVVRGAGDPIVVMCFRSEIHHEVYWGGDPATPAVRDEQHRLAPRKSFDLWRETVRGQSRPWGEILPRRLQTLFPLIAAALPEMEGSAGLVEAINELITIDDERLNVAELALHAAREGIAIVDSRQRQTPRIIHANAGIFDLFGVDPLLGDARDLRRQMLAAGVSEEALDAVSARFECWTASRGHRVLASERRPTLTLACHSGERVWSTVYIRDITIDHRRMQAMVAARDQARLATGMQADMLSNMSHEMRTPLNAVIGFSDILKSGDDLAPDDRKEYIDYIHEAGKHLLDLVNNLLDVARIEGGRLPILDEEILDLSELLRSTLGWLQPIAERKEVRLEPLENTMDGSTRLLGDSQRLRQVAINLLSNAIKYTPANGNVRTLLGQEPSGAIYFEVIDSGIGIPEAQVALVFERFHRVEDARTKRAEGSGLGLFLARALCELHGGAISIESKVDRGTRVRVTLPASRRSMAEA